MTRLTVFLILLAAQINVLNAQNCDDPALLCAEVSNPDNITTANAVSFACIDASFSYFYTFTTNNLVAPGNVIVSFNGIDCFTNGLSDTIQAVIVEVLTGADPCLNTSYVAVSDCVEDTLDFSIESDELNPSSEYLVIIGTNHSPFDGPCGVDVQIDGPAVDIVAGYMGDFGFVSGDVEITLGETANVSVEGGSASPGYSWSPNTFIDTPIGSDILSTPEETIDYVVTGFVGDCEVTDIITVIVGPPIGIPNTITPNGDGINDLWKIGGISEFPFAEITVFSRWGQKVFVDTGYEEPWDGTNKGNSLPTATYYYVIELNSQAVNIEPITGIITLIH